MTPKALRDSPACSPSGLWSLGEPQQSLQEEGGHVLELPGKWRRGGREPKGAAVPEGFPRAALESLPRDQGTRNPPWLTEPDPVARGTWVGRRGGEQEGGGKWLSLRLQEEGSGAGGGWSGDWVQRKLPEGAGTGAAAWPQLARVSASSPSRKRMGGPVCRKFNSLRSCA